MREHPDNQDRLLYPSPEDTAPLRWLKAHARYVRVRLGGRALVTVWLSGGRALEVHHVFALRGESILLQGRLQDGTELHVSMRPDAVSLEMRPAPDGEPCTGFAFLGVSRTPQPFVERTNKAAAPPPHDHEHHH
jgi:hypothetical protein